MVAGGHDDLPVRFLAQLTKSYFVVDHVYTPVGRRGLSVDCLLHRLPMQSSVGSTERREESEKQNSSNARGG